MLTVSMQKQNCTCCSMSRLHISLRVKSVHVQHHSKSCSVQSGMTHFWCFLYQATMVNCITPPSCNYMWQRNEYKRKRLSRRNRSLLCPSFTTWPVGRRLRDTFLKKWWALICCMEMSNLAEEPRSFLFTLSAWFCAKFNQKLFWIRRNFLQQSNNNVNTDLHNVWLFWVDAASWPCLNLVSCNVVSAWVE